MTIRDQILSYVEQHPGLTPNQVSKAVGRTPNSVSGQLSLLFKRGSVVREGEGTSGEPYRYQVVSHSGGNGTTVTVKTPRRRRLMATPRVGVLVTIQYGRKESITLSYDEAAQVYKQLSGMFGSSSK